MNAALFAMVVVTAFVILWMWAWGLPRRKLRDDDYGVRNE